MLLPSDEELRQRKEEKDRPAVERKKVLNSRLLTLIPAGTQFDLRSLYEAAITVYETSFDVYPEIYGSVLER